MPQFEIKKITTVTDRYRVEAPSDAAAFALVNSDSAPKYHTSQDLTQNATIQVLQGEQKKSLAA